MPKIAREMGALDIKRLAHTGKTRLTEFRAVGGIAGLHMQITANGAKSWVLRIMVGGRRREMGLGSYPEITLAAAWDRAREARDKLLRGVDPIAEKRAAKAALVAAEKRGMTFKAASEKCLAARLKGLKNAKHQLQWQATLDTYAMPEIGKMLVSEITRADVLRVLQPIWETKTETASRLRGRIETVLDWAAVNGHRSGDNPARLKGNLEYDLAKKSAVAKNDNHPAVKIEDASRWFCQIRARDGMGSRALEFLALTAARSGEVRGAVWSEIDLEARLWTIPAERMKAGEEHVVPLTDDAIALLKALTREDGVDLVFPAVRGGMLSDMTLSACMKRVHADDVKNGGAGFLDKRSGRPAVPHGLRSTFRDWAGDKTSFEHAVIEAALAHAIGSKTEKAYRRGTAIEKRGLLMQAWAGFLHGRKADPASNVVPIQRGAA